MGDYGLSCGERLEENLNLFMAHIGEDAAYLSRKVLMMGTRHSLSAGVHVVAFKIRIRAPRF